MKKTQAPLTIPSTVLGTQRSSTIIAVGCDYAESGILNELG